MIKHCTENFIGIANVKMAPFGDVSIHALGEHFGVVQSTKFVRFISKKELRKVGLYITNGKFRRLAYGKHGFIGAGEIKQKKEKENV